MKELIKAEEEKTLFIGRHGNECIYVVRAVSREAAMHLLNEVMDMLTTFVWAAL